MASSGDYEVGYGKPPKEHRYRSGKSGNPRGRPKGIRAKCGSGIAMGRLVRDLFLKVGKQPITIVQQGEESQVPLAEGVIRALSASALKGDRAAQKFFLENVARAEAEDWQEDQERFLNALEYKSHWTESIQRAARVGRPEPEVFPHPDDVVVDARRGEVTVVGPMNQQEREATDKLLGWRDEYQKRVLLCAKSLKENPTKPLWRTLLLRAQSRFDWINERVPPRHRTILQGRLGRAPDYSAPFRGQLSFLDVLQTVITECADTIRSASSSENREVAREALIHNQAIFDIENAKLPVDLRRILIDRLVSDGKFEAA